jgi:hypothetical protein
VKPTNEPQQFAKCILSGLQDGACALQETSSDLAQQISNVLSKAIAPVLLGVDGGEESEEADDEDEETAGTTKAYRRVAQRCLAVSPSAIEALVLLSKKTTPAVLAKDEDLLLALAAYTDPSQPYVPSKDTSETANQLLQDLLAANNTTNDQFIVQTILQRHLRQLFSKSKPASITSSGRKAEYIDPSAGRGEGIPDDSDETKPWKFSDFRAIPLATYSVNQADASHLLLAPSSLPL